MESKICISKNLKFLSSICINAHCMTNNCSQNSIRKRNSYIKAFQKVLKKKGITNNNNKILLKVFLEMIMKVLLILVNYQILWVKLKIQWKMMDICKLLLKNHQKSLNINKITLLWLNYSTKFSCKVLTIILTGLTKIQDKLIWHKEQEAI